jgi:glycine dehydrogenase subunit 1
MVEIGEAIMQRSRYAMKKIAQITGIKVLFSGSHHFNEFVVNFDGSGKSVAAVNQALLEQGIFGGKDLSAEFPELGQSALYCVTEIHSQADIDLLVETLAEVTQ